MANIWEVGTLILTGILNSGLSYLITTVHMVDIQLVFGPTCAEPIYVDWRRYRVVNSLLCRDNPLCVLIIPRNMSTQRFSSRLELISWMLDIFETDLIQVPSNSKCLTLNVDSFYWFLDTLLTGPLSIHFIVSYFESQYHLLRFSLYKWLLFKSG